jgi:hypothetical protein
MAGFGNSGVKPPGSAAIVLVGSKHRGIRKYVSYLQFV